MWSPLLSLRPSDVTLDKLKELFAHDGEEPPEDRSEGAVPVDA